MMLNTEISHHMSINLEWSQEHWQIILNQGAVSIAKAIIKDIDPLSKSHVESNDER
jgi:hypothetical protein